MPLEDPVRCPGGYTLDLYCRYRNPDHAFDAWPVTFFGEHGSKVRGEARRAGWLLHRDGTATCPLCARMLARGGAR